MRNKLINGVMILAIASLSFLQVGCSGKKSSSTSLSGSTTSGSSHTCLKCGKNYTGKGWMTVGGEQYQPESDNGDQYCSKTCAYESQSGKWKRAK